MSVEKVRKYLEKWNAGDRIMEFDESSATVELAAKALNCEPARIAKTLSFRINDRIIIIVTAGDTKIDNKKYKAYFNAKAKMLQFDEVEELTGHKAGGVCPFALNPGTEVYLDESLKRFETVFPACGSASSAIELTPDELREFSCCDRWIDVCSLKN